MPIFVEKKSEKGAFSGFLAFRQFARYRQSKICSGKARTISSTMQNFRSLAIILFTQSRAEVGEFFAILTLANAILAHFRPYLVLLHPYYASHGVVFGVKMTVLMRPFHWYLMSTEIRRTFLVIA